MLQGYDELEANDAGADDALMLDTSGKLAETNATRLFLVNDGRVTTPSPKACPTGITRATILKLCDEHDIPSEVRDISREELDAADEVFCTGTMGEIVPVTQLDETVFQHGLAGPLTRRLADLYRDLTETEGSPLVNPPGNTTATPTG